MDKEKVPLFAEATASVGPKRAATDAAASDSAEYNLILLGEVSTVHTGN